MPPAEGWAVGAGVVGIAVGDGVGYNVGVEVGAALGATVASVAVAVGPGDGAALRAQNAIYVLSKAPNRPGKHPRLSKNKS